MTEVLESIKSNRKTEEKTELIFAKYSNEPYRTQSQISQTALIHRRVFEEAIVIMRDCGSGPTN